MWPYDPRKEPIFRILVSSQAEEDGARCLLMVIDEKFVWKPEAALLGLLALITGNLKSRTPPFRQRGRTETRNKRRGPSAAIKFMSESGLDGLQNLSQMRSAVLG